MKVLFDISVLGLGHVMPRARTGVFRVVEHTALGLLASEECELAFSVSQGDFLQCLEYIKATALLAEYRTHPSDSTLPSLNKLLALISWDRGKPYLYYIVEALLSERLRNEIVFAVAPSMPPDCADIYHSPYHAIPEWVDYRKQKVFQTVYDLIPVLYPQYFFKFRHAFKSFQKALATLTYETNILCISQSTKNDLCNHVKTIDPDKVSVIPLAASGKFYQCIDAEKKALVRQKYAIPSDAAYFLSVSTLESRKNIDLTIKCFVRILQEEKRKDLYLVLTGSKGWRYDQIFSELARTEKFRERIILTGYVPDEDLAPLYSDALAFVYPSFYEGFGLPPLEAMQCGTPVITSDTSSLPEVVGDAGIMVKPTDADALCQAMLRVYGDAGLRGAMKRKSLERARMFSWQRYTEDLLALYRQALLA